MPSALLTKEIKFINPQTFEAAFISGIYTIINRKNNRFYVGENVNINRRKDEHYLALEKGTHYNKELQSDYNRYCKDPQDHSAFEFKILLLHMNPAGILFTEAELLILENEFINRYRTTGYNLYNIEKTLDDIINNRNMYSKTLGSSYNPVLKHMVTLSINCRRN